MTRRSLSAYEKFLLAQTSESQNGVGLTTENEEEGGEQTEAASKSSGAEEEKRLSEPIHLTVSTSSSASPPLDNPLALTVRQHVTDERKEPRAAKSTLQQQHEEDEEKEDEEESDSEEVEDGQSEGESQHRTSQPVHNQRSTVDSDGQYAGADELGLLDDVDALPIEGLSPLPIDREENEVEEEEPLLQQDEEEDDEWMADQLSPLPQHTEQQHDEDDNDTEQQTEAESEASDSSVDTELDHKINAHKAALSHYTVQPHPSSHSHTAVAAEVEDVTLLSTVREGNEDDEHSHRTLSSTATPTASAHRWFTDLVNRPSFLSPNSPTAPPTRFSLSSSSQHSTPNERSVHSHKRSSLPSPLPHSSFQHPEYNSPSAFFAAKSGQLGSLSGSRSNRPSFSTPYEAATAAGELASPSAVGRLSFTPFRRSGRREEDGQRTGGREERGRLEQDEEEDEKKINRSLVFQSPHRPQPSAVSRSTHRSSLPPRPPPAYRHNSPAAGRPTVDTAQPANLHVLPSANLRHCHLFLHFHSTLPHSTLLPLVTATLRHHIVATALYSSLTDKGSGRWVLMCVLEGEGSWVAEWAGWCGGVESVLVGYGMSGMDFVVLTPLTAHTATSYV